MSSPASSKSTKNAQWATVRERPRKDGSVGYAVLYNYDGRQPSVTFDDRPAADALVSLIKAHGAERALQMYGVEVAPKQRGTDSGPTVADFVDRHIDGLSGLERKTIAEYRRYLERDIKPALGDIPLAALQRTDITGWINQMHAAGSSTATISNKAGFLSGCLNQGVADGKLSANPAAGVKLPRTVRREMEILTVGEYDIVKAAFQERWHPLLDLLVSSGCRFSEATALRPRDVDRTAGTIRIARAWKRIPDGSGERYEMGLPKTQRSTRTIHIPAAILDQLDLTHEYVFTNSKGGPVRLYSWRSNVWVKSLAKAKAVDPDNPDKPVLTKAIRIHDLRHTAASWLLGAGVPLIVVSAHLGHEDSSVTSKVYGHMIPGAGKAAADAMAELLA